MSPTATPADSIPSIVYARVSTADQAADGHGIDAQIEACRHYAAAFSYVPVAEAVDAGVSGAVDPEDRPALADALARLDAGDAKVLIVHSLSRLARDTIAVLRLADRAKSMGWDLVVLDLRLDTTTAAGRFSLTVLAAVAELERGQCSERTRAGLAAAKRKGVRLGGPVSAHTRTAGPRAAVLHAGGMTWRQVAQRLTDEGYLTARGGSTWGPGQAHRAARSVRLDAEAAARRGDA